MKIFVFVLVEGGILLGAVVANSITPLAPLWVWGFASIACFASALVIYRWQLDSSVDVDMKQGVSQGAIEKVNERQERPFTLRTVEEITSEFEGRTEMQAQRIVKEYIGKWLEVDDVVGDVAEFSDEIMVVVGELQSKRVWLRFEKEQWLGTLETLRVGDRITARGEISDVRSYRITLRDCEALQLQRSNEAESKRS